ncbi:MAG TPA: TetR/AcrR family transcriptional regulator [Sphingomonas sp.]|nr:TetR/AcrR family transcriptional regulator [Sphingomonas sp.]
MTKAAAETPRPRGNRQRERTRTALLSAGQALFATRAVDSVTVDDIVGAADVAKGSFYNHFADKDEFAATIYELVQGDVEFHIFSVNQEVTDAPTRIARALCTVMRYALDHPERLMALLSMSERRTTSESPLNAGVSADVRHGIEQGRLCNMDLETGVLMVIGTVQSTVRHAMSGDAKAFPADLASSMAGALLRALGLPYAEAQSLGRAAADDLLRGEA